MKTIAIAFVISLSINGCFDQGDRPVGVSPEPATTPAPDQESFDVELYESSNGIVRYRIRAAYMASYETADSSYVLLSRRTDGDTQVQAVLFDSGSDGSTTIEADEIRFFETDHRFEARGNVVVRTTTQRTLETDFLVWREDDRRVVAPGFVRIVSPNEDMQGYGFDADENLESFSLQRVTGQYYLEDE